jgi:hypothetical protein
VAKTLPFEMETDELAQLTTRVLFLTAAAAEEEIADAAADMVRFVDESVEARLPPVGGLNLTGVEERFVLRRDEFSIRMSINGM